MTDALRVRPYEDGDRDAVVALWALVFPDEPPWNDSEVLIARKLTVQRQLFFVAQWQGVIVGTVVAGFDGVRGWVHKVATRPDCRRQGIARRLMDAAEQGLRALGCDKLNLQVREGNDSAVRFYQSAGYAVEPRVSMGKRL